MRATTVFSTLALASAVFAAPTPKASNNGDISESNPMDQDGNFRRDNLNVVAELGDSAKSLHAAAERIPIPKVQVSARGLGLPTDSVIDQATDALPITDVTGLAGELPVDPKVIDILPIDTGIVRRSGNLVGSLANPVLAQLAPVISMFDSITSSLSGVSTKLNSLLPGHVANLDAQLDGVLATLNSVTPQVNQVIASMQAADVNGILADVTNLANSDSAKQVTTLIVTSQTTLTQVITDADSMSGLPIGANVSKLNAIKSVATNLMHQIKSAAPVAISL